MSTKQIYDVNLRILLRASESTEYKNADACHKTREFWEFMVTCNICINYYGIGSRTHARTRSCTYVEQCDRLTLTQRPDYILVLVSQLQPELPRSSQARPGCLIWSVQARTRKQNRCFVHA